MSSSPFRIDPYGPYAQELARLNHRLNPHERVFISEYLVDLDPRRAAVAAGMPAKRGWSYLTHNHNVKRAIELAQMDRTERLRITADKITQEYAKLAFSNMGDYMATTAGGDPYFDYAGLDRDHKAAIAEMVVEEYVDGRGPDARDVKRVKFKLHDKKAALDSVARHLGMFVDRTEIRGEMNIRLANMTREERVGLMYDLLGRVQHLLPRGETIDMEPVNDG